MFLQLLLVLMLAANLGVNAQTCPPNGFDSAKGFEVLKYLRGNATSSVWYIQQQMVNAYQPQNELYCVRAAYVPRDVNNLNSGITVINTARRGSVTGTAVGSGTSGAPNLLAFPDTTLLAGGTSATRASKLRVGPSFLSGLWRISYGPYWIVAAGKSADNTNYDWAIVTGGAPRTVTAGGCVVGPVNPGPTDVNNAGFWLFSRRPVDPAATATMRSEAARLGLDLSVLKVVQQQGCVYPALPTSASARAAADAAGAATSEVATVAEPAAVAALAAPVEVPALPAALNPLQAAAGADAAAAGLTVPLTDPLLQTAGVNSQPVAAAATVAAATTVLPQQAVVEAGPAAVVP